MLTEEETKDLTGPEQKIRRENLSISIDRIRKKIEAKRVVNKMFWDAIDLEEVETLLKTAEWSIIDFLTPFKAAAEKWKSKYEERIAELEAKVDDLEQRSEVKSTIVNQYQKERQSEARKLIIEFGLLAEFADREVKDDDWMYTLVNHLVLGLRRWDKFAYTRTESTQIRSLIRKLVTETWDEVDGHEA